MHGTTTTARAKRSRKAFWLKQLHTWHWISSAISLVGLLLFAVTGFTLNHAAEIEGSPQTIERKGQLPAQLLPAIRPDDAPDAKKPLPAPVAEWVEGNLDIRHARGEAEWSADEIYLALPRPGGDGWVAIDRASGAVTTEATNRGWIAWLNDLHKGRNSGTVWKWFIDIFVLACIVFSLTGLVLLQMHSKNRPSTWPLVGAGLVIPAFLAIFFIHI
ncbi:MULTISPECIES: PepSY-associated TM helix domain-containing protein [unclassified Sphingomonas]|uniref:PepSY-associated TM helix domain-containing protein n=1 Tax=unclassified Sphingomonas TaxID=196159 RepID=UPI0021511D8D|nr:MULTISPECIES: PepSY-associated TM helix domain-containing protein [unclassified Sphingomonas]MCR5871165.1 PepSY-associated TM helix domain-containing protein [Sphingomonas sp. J344]UUY00521.1 PepSY-associated TM helix domain-containing protein [Sphingomonas sp. J315]